MSKKKLSALFSLASLFLISGSLVGCGEESSSPTEPPVSDKESGNPTEKPTEKPTEPSKETKPSTHECVFYKVDAKEATCVSKGNIEYEQCPYCKKIMVDGKEATEESVILPIDPNNHVHLTDVPGKEPTCLESGIKAHQHCEDCKKDLINGQEVTENDYTIQASDEYHQLVSVEGSLPDCGHTGVKAHQKCDICHKVFVDGAEVTPESLVLPIADSHTYDEHGNCPVCGVAFKYTVDSVEKEFGSSSYFSIRATSTGESMYSTTTDTKTAVANSLAADPMSFSTQMMAKSNSEYYSEVAYTSDAITITHIKEQNTNCGFTRFAPGVRAEDGSITSYVGKFLFSMDVTLSSDVYVQRLGAMIADNTLNVVKGDGISQSLLLGKGEASKFAEANPNRTFEAGVKYRFIYQMETTDATQLVQIFSCSAPTTIKIENIHVLPVEGAAGVVSSTLLFAGKSDMVTNEKDYVPEPEPEPEPDPSAKSYKLYNGKDFFKYDDWTVNAENDSTAQTSAIINSDGNLEFTNATPSRIHLFHVATLNTGSFTHFGENGKKFTDEDPFTYFNTEFTYTMDMKVHGSFDMLVLGSGKANSKTTKQAGLYFTFGSDGSITLTRQAAKADARAVDAFTVSNAFVQDTQFSLSIKLNRVDKSTLKYALEINGSPVAFTGETVTTSALSLSVDENGVFTDANWFASNGMGQRFGVLPEADSTVTISSLSITPELTPVETA